MPTGAWRLCLNPNTLVALLFGEGHCTALSADFLVVLALSPLPNKENISNRNKIVLNRTKNIERDENPKRRKL